MKKFSFLAAAVLSVILFSCNGGSNVKLVSQNDSLSYAISLAKTEGLSEVMYQQLGVDSAYVQDFIKGVRDAFVISDDAEAKAYKAGLQIGLQAERVCQGANSEAYPDDTVNSIDKQLFIEGLIAGVLNDSSAMTFDEAKEYYEGIVYKRASDEFIANNKTQPGVVVTESGLQYQIITEGTGEKAALTDTVKCIYTGTLTNGRTFDSSRGKEVSFAVNQVIPGWTEALQMMGEGSKWKLFIPWNLAYGATGNRGIPPYSALIFEVEVKDVVKAK